MASIDADTNSTQRTWHREPVYRGTWGIYSTCIVTAGLCVWQAVHLNLPPPYEKWSGQFWRKVGWMILASLAPELVAGTAWTQYRAAKSIYNSVNTEKVPWYSWIRAAVFAIISAPDRIRMRIKHNVGREELRDLERSRDTSKGRFTMACAFFVTMGGLVVAQKDETSTSASGYWNIANTKVVKALVENGELQLSHTEVADRSKSSAVTRTIILVQVLWFCSQVLTRLTMKLDTTLLELNTFVHCICAGAIYILWWNKPYDIASHVTVRESAAVAIRCAQAFHLHAPREQNAWTDDPNLLRLARAMAPSSTQNWLSITCSIARFRKFVESCVLVQTDDEVCAFQVPGHGWRCTYSQDGKHAKSAADIAVAVGDVIPRTGFRVRQLEVSSAPTVWFNDFQLRHWQDLWSECQCPKAAHLLSNWESNACKDRQWNWIHRNSLKAPEYTGVMLALILAPALYGTLNALAWNYEFGSKPEMIIWRCSSVIVAAFGFGILTLVFVFWLLSEMPPSEIAVYLIALLAMITCILARAFLLVEAFFALPESPAGVYQVPRWSEYLPHIG